MYAVIRVSGFQYRVEKGQVLRVPLLQAEEGDSLTLEQVLLVGDGKELKVGRPVVEGATVSAEVLGHGRSPKLVAGKFKRRRKYRRRWGHRQAYTEIKISDIQASAS
jgi:large subunit ribosomal protein L21